MSDLIKLRALKENVFSWLYKFHRGTANYFDPKIVSDLFSRYDVISKRLRSEKPSYFGDLSEREVKSSGTTDFNGRGYFFATNLKPCLMILSFVSIFCQVWNLSIFHL